MTITPHIVRLLETPTKEAQAFWSGTEETYSTKPLFSELPVVEDIKESPDPPAVPQPQPQSSAPPTGLPTVLTLRPSESTASPNQEITLAAEIQNVKDLTEAVISLSYDPGVLEFRQAVEGPFMGSDGQQTAFVTASNPEDGLINLRIRRVSNSGKADGSGVLFGLSFTGKTAGSSPVLFQTSQFFNPTRESLPVSFVSGRVNVK
jgi:hypothetical protein